MAGASLLALLDDIASLMDDVSAMTKVAAQKTAGVLGDDLAVNAEKVTGVAAERELPVVFAVFRGSMINKAILVPVAILIAAVADWLITPLLIAGGLFLCFEGAEKVWHALRHRKKRSAGDGQVLRARLEATPADAEALEKKRIRGAIRTDLILSAEIIVITLGIVGDQTLAVRAGVLTTIAFLMTVGVYGLVAAIVKIDDAGLHLFQLKGESSGTSAARFLGRGLLALAPRFMRLLTIVGTLAMFLVGGGILVHGIPAVHHLSETLVHSLEGSSSSLIAALSAQTFAGLSGLFAGSAILLFLGLGARLRSSEQGAQ